MPNAVAIVIQYSICSYVYYRWPYALNDCDFIKSRIFLYLLLLLLLLRVASSSICCLRCFKSFILSLTLFTRARAHNFLLFNFFLSSPLLSASSTRCGAEKRGTGTEDHSWHAIGMNKGFFFHVRWYSHALHHLTHTSFCMHIMIILFHRSPQNQHQPISLRVTDTCFACSRDDIRYAQAPRKHIHISISFGGHDSYIRSRTR